MLKAIRTSAPIINEGDSAPDAGTTETSKPADNHVRISCLAQVSMYAVSCRFNAWLDAAVSCPKVA